MVHPYLIPYLPQIVDERNFRSESGSNPSAKVAHSHPQLGTGSASFSNRDSQNGDVGRSEKLRFNVLFHSVGVINLVERFERALNR